MRSFKRVLWITMWVCPLVVLACVTINIYFPAEKVESVAGEIVSEIRGQESQDNKEEPKKNDKTSSLRQSLLALRLSSAWADEVITVSNATIRALKQAMKERYPQMKPFYQRGMLREGDDGYVSVADAAELGLKEKRDLNNLVAAENRDRGQLYEEVAKALNIDPSQTGKVAEIFAKEWQKPVR